MRRSFRIARSIATAPVPRHPRRSVAMVRLRWGHKPTRAALHAATYRSPSEALGSIAKGERPGEVQKIKPGSITLQQAGERYRDAHMKRKGRSSGTIESYRDHIERLFKDWLDRPVRRTCCSYFLFFQTLVCASVSKGICCKTQNAIRTSSNMPARAESNASKASVIRSTPKPDAILRGPISRKDRCWRPRMIAKNGTFDVAAENARHPSPC
jgi:hypothetical protein